MTKEELIEAVPFIYHLTDERNLEYIYETGKLYSAISLLEMGDVPNREAILKERRTSHFNLEVDGFDIWIRDQRPLNVALDKCLTHGWTRERFIHSLNSRVFFWPNIKRLTIHYGRYKREKPVILRMETELALERNAHVKLCRLNSGATRPSHHLGGKAPERGPNTFMPLKTYNRPPNSIAEVTFEAEFSLPEEHEIARKPLKRWSFA